jgi:hypothetical protein
MESDVKLKCEDKSRLIRLNAWEARNYVQFRLKISNVNSEKIEICAQDIIRILDEEKKFQVETLKKIILSEESVFKNSIKKLRKSVDFVEFQKIIENQILIEDLNENKYLSSDVLYIRDASDKPIKRNFLTAYVANFVNNERTLYALENMTNSKLELKGKKYHKKNNIIKLNTSLLILFVIMFLIINFKYFYNFKFTEKR